MFNSIILKHILMKSFLSILFATALTSTLLMTSCSDDASLFTSEDTENFVDESIFAIQSNAVAGRGGCLELVFPINVIFPDQTTFEASDYESLRAELKAWYEANAEDLGLPAKGEGPRGERPDIDPSLLPTLDFPIEAITSEGETISIADKEELHTLRRACKREMRRGRKGDKCFKPVFPLTIVFPDGTEAAFDDRKALKTALREWKDANPDSEDRPTLKFPVTVELEDGATQEVGSKEDLELLKETCANG